MLRCKFLSVKEGIALFLSAPVLVIGIDAVGIVVVVVIVVAVVVVVIIVVATVVGEFLFNCLQLLFLLLAFISLNKLSHDALLLFQLKSRASAATFARTTPSSDTQMPLSLAITFELFLPFCGKKESV